MVYQWRNASAPQGSECYFWFTAYEASGITPTLPAGMTLFSPSQIGVGNLAFYGQWAWGIRIGAAVTPGQYTIATVAGTQLVVNVVASPAPRDVVQIGPGTSLAATQAALDAGDDVELLPGLHYWAGELTPPDGSTVKSAGAKIVALPHGAYGNRLFAPEGDFTLDGVTLTSDRDTLWPVYIHTSDLSFAGRVTVRGCTLLSGVLSRLIVPGLLVEDCTFQNATTEVSSLSVYRGNRFIGPNSFGAHPWFNTGADGCLCVTNTWDRTSRGMVFQSGDARGTVAIENYFSGIRGGQLNANEVILFEAGVNGSKVPVGASGINNNTFVNTYISECAGPGVSFYGSGMHDNVFWVSEIATETVSLSMVALNGGAMGRNTFDNAEMTGALNFVGNIGTFTAANFHVLESLWRHGGDSGSYTATYRNRVLDAPIVADATARARGAFQFTGCGYVSQGQYRPLTALPSPLSSNPTLNGVTRLGV